MRLSCVFAVAGVAVAAAAPARADFKVWQPDPEPHEFALESVGDIGQDIVHAKRGEQSYTEEMEYGVTNWWTTELEWEQERLPGPGNTTNLSQVTSENLFIFTEPGERWMDAAFFVEYGQSTLPDAPNETTFGPVLRKQIGRTINSVNLFISKDIGRYATSRPQFQYAWETRLDLGSAIEPGFQAYGSPGAFGHFAPTGQQDHRAGPVIFGTFASLGPGSLKWNAGVLFGLTPGAPRQTFRWQGEYELHF
jgi:hypothetical protein